MLWKKKKILFNNEFEGTEKLSFLSKMAFKLSQLCLLIFILFLGLQYFFSLLVFVSVKV